MKKEIRGEYLAPKVEVEEMELEQHLLDISSNIDIDGNPFSNNDETDWAKESDDMDWSFDDSTQW